MEITRGKIRKAKKVVVHGPEGIGKSTFASQFPEPVFIDTEGSTNSMDVARLPRPTSWTMVLEEIDYIKKTPGVCRTLVIDTIDWAEQLCVEYICDKHQKKGIEDFGYGNGYVYVKEEFGRFLNRLTDVTEAGINVVLTAHAQLRKFEQPDELRAYDRWELKLGKKTSSQTSPLVKEWSDMLLFCNYKTHTVAVDDKGKKKKAMGGGKRVMYTAHHPCWDAKNRYSLPDECEFDYCVIASIIGQEGTARDGETKVSDQPVNGEKETKRKETPDFMDIPEGSPEQLEFDTSPPPEPAGKTEEKHPHTEPNKSIPKGSVFHVDERIPKALRDLMEEKLVSEEEMTQVVSNEGYVPKGTHVWEFDKVNPGIIEGLLIPSWPQVYAKIEKLRESYAIPFDEDKK